ncbi:hypothetical protein IAU59_006773 [Kwoniella sp. CBS 9459]
MPPRRSSSKKDAFSPSVAYAYLFGDIPQHWHVDPRPASTPTPTRISTSIPDLGPNPRPACLTAHVQPLTQDEEPDRLFSTGYWLHIQKCPDPHCRALITNCSCGYNYPLDLVASWIKQTPGVLPLLLPGEGRLPSRMEGCQGCSETCSRCHQRSRARLSGRGGIASAKEKGNDHETGGIGRERLHTYAGPEKKLCPAHRKQGDPLKIQAEAGDRLMKGLRIFERLQNDPAALAQIANVDPRVCALYMQWQAQVTISQANVSPLLSIATFLRLQTSLPCRPQLASSSASSPHDMQHNCQHATSQPKGYVYPDPGVIGPWDVDLVRPYFPTQSHVQMVDFPTEPADSSTGTGFWDVGTPDHDPHPDQMEVDELVGSYHGSGPTVQDEDRTNAFSLFDWSHAPGTNMSAICRDNASAQVGHRDYGYNEHWVSTVQMHDHAASAPQTTKTTDFLEQPRFMPAHDLAMYDDLLWEPLLASGADQSSSDAPRMYLDTYCGPQVQPCGHFVAGTSSAASDTSATAAGRIEGAHHHDLTAESLWHYIQ